MTCYACLKKCDINEIETVETVNAKYLICGSCAKILERSKELIKENAK